MIEHQQAKDALQERHRFEALITTISTNFINMPIDRISDGINQALQLVGEFVGADYSYVFLLSKDKLTVSNTHSWRAEGVSGPVEQLQDLPVASFPWMKAKLNQFEIVYIASVANMPAQLAFEQRFLQTHQVQSLVQVPMVCDEELTGILGFASIRAEKTWSKEIIFLLKIVSEIFVNALLRQQVDQELKARAHQQELLVKEIHHRVKNNLQVVSSLLRLQARYTNDAQFQEVLRDSQNRIKSMALIHAKLYQDHDLAKIDFAQYVKSLGAYLFQSYAVDPAAIQLRINIDKIYLDIDTAIPCGLIINELVSNALKYAFPAEGKSRNHINLISIDLHADRNDRLILTVHDNGVGLPSDIAPYQTDSLGLQLVIRLSEQLKGSVEIDRSQGTTFSMTFSRTKID